MHDYFTQQEFGHAAGDPRAERYTSAAIDEAQAEVIAALEAWAGTSWANVPAPLVATGTMAAAGVILVASAAAFAAEDVGKPISVQGAGTAGGDLLTTVAGFTSATTVTLADAAAAAVAGAVLRMAPSEDGWAAGYRQAVDYLDGDAASFVLGAVKVQGIRAITENDAAVDVTAYALDPGAGTLRFASELGAGLRRLVVAYAYGAGTCPPLIKRPAMAATKALLDPRPEKKGRIPANTERFTTEGATIVLGGEEPTDEPWPWEKAASKAVRTYWGPYRPRVTGARV